MSNDKNNPEIIFLGTGGGRVNLIKQWRATGGFRINSRSASIHVDPGPGALLNGLKYGQNPASLDAVIVTHFHIDHCLDAPLLLEAMSGYALKKGGIFIGSEYAVNGDKDGDRSISKYHIDRAENVYSAKFEERKKFITRRGSFEIEIIRTKHDEPTAFGFKLFLDSRIIGYTGDTEYSDALAKKFEGCDVLIANCLKPSPDGIPDHMKTSDIVHLLNIAKPSKLAILTHMGMKFLKVGPEREAKRIENETGTRCVAAKDGERFEI